MVREALEDKAEKERAEKEGAYERKLRAVIDSDRKGLT